MANKKLHCCDWCLKEQKKVYGDNEIYDSEENCSFREYCLNNSKFNKELSKKEFNEFMREI